MKVAIVILVLVLFIREILRICWTIEHNAAPMKILLPCFFACVIAILAKLIGNVLTMV